jgi:Na+-driven multidrug efflux pump
MNISNVVFNTFSILFLSVGASISLMLGHILGTGDTEGAKGAAKKMITFSVGMGLVCTVLVSVCAPFFPLLYNTSEEVRTLATNFTFVIALASPIHAYLNSAYFTIRSGGKTGTVFLFDSVYAWGVNVALAFVLANFTTLPIVAVYACCQGVDILKCTIGTILVARGKWAVDLTQKV